MRELTVIYIGPNLDVLMYVFSRHLSRETLLSSQG